MSGSTIPTTPDQAPRRRSRRDRRGRGLRGPLWLPLTPLAKRPPAAGEQFDRLALATVTALDALWQERISGIEYAVEEVPLLAADFDGDRVPLSTLVKPTATAPARIVLHRRPIERRATHRDEVVAVIEHELRDRVAELLGIDPDELPMP